MSRPAFAMLPYLLLLCIFPGFKTIAQGTGSFNTNITFMGAQRQISCYVPVNYDPATPVALMIGLHGLGDNSISYRNAAINILGFAANLPNTILICPDGGSDLQKDFYTPAGDEAVIQECIQYARTHYNIDTTAIILQGFSLGGRSALRYGLQHTGIFKGLLLNTPAIQGVKEAVAGYTSGGLYNYDNAPATPVYITHGTTDLLYTAPIDSMSEQLIRHNGKVKLVRFAGGHTVPTYTQQPFQPFFQQPAQAQYDVSLSHVTLPARSCSNQVSAKVLVQNTGSAMISSIHLNYSDGATNHAYTWSGNLPPFQHETISLPVLTQTAAGQYTLTVSADTVNGNVPDQVAANNSGSAVFRIATASLPVEERFDNVNYQGSWLLQRSGDQYMPWSYDEDQHAIFSFNSVFIFDNAGRREELLSPLMDVSNTPQLFAHIDIAYNYTRFTAAVSGIDTVLADTLEIMISNDCGNTFQTIYAKGGTDLSTYPQPITDPNSLAAYELSPGQANWRKEVINLSPYLSSGQIILKFSYKSALGGSILLDNITFSQNGTGIEEAFKPQVTLSPNPANDLVTIQSGSDKIERLQICDITGRAIKTIVAGSTSLRVPVTSLENGVYLFRIKTAKGTASQKVVVHH